MITYGRFFPKIVTEMTMVELIPDFPDIEPTNVHDLKLLTNDSKFSLILDKFKKIMTLRFDTLMKFSHSGRK